MRPRSLFLVKFGVLIALFSLALSQTVVYRYLIAPFTRFINVFAVLVLNGLGQSATARDTLIISSTFAVDVKNGCNGIEAMLILVAAILAYPAPWPLRIRGMLIGSAIVQLANIIRIAVLFMVGQGRPELFEMMHMTILQGVMFLIAILYFAFWSRKFAEAPAATPNS